MRRGSPPGGLVKERSGPAQERRLGRVLSSKQAGQRANFRRAWEIERNSPLAPPKASPLLRAKGMQ